jgi:hypothetical protein
MLQHRATPPSKATATFGRIVLEKVASVRSGKESGSVGLVVTWLKPDGAPLLADGRGRLNH